MLGIVLFIYALLSYIVQESGRLSIIVALPGDAPAAANHDRGKITDQ